MNPALPTSALLLALSLHTPPVHTIFDFQTNPAAATWTIVNDDVMGGVSTSSFEIIDGIASFRGTVSFENNGGFASARSPLPPIDLTGADALVLRVRGDGKRYKLTARMQPSLDSSAPTRWDPCTGRAKQTPDGSPPPHPTQTRLRRRASRARTRAHGSQADCPDMRRARIRAARYGRRRHALPPTS